MHTRQCFIKTIQNLFHRCGRRFQCCYSTKVCVSNIIHASLVKRWYRLLLWVQALSKLRRPYMTSCDRLCLTNGKRFALENSLCASNIYSADRCRRAVHQESRPRPSRVEEDRQGLVEMARICSWWWCSWSANKPSVALIMKHIMWRSIFRMKRIVLHRKSDSITVLLRDSTRQDGIIFRNVFCTDVLRVTVHQWAFHNASHYNCHRFHQDSKNSSLAFICNAVEQKCQKWPTK